MRYLTSSLLRRQRVGMRYLTSKIVESTDTVEVGKFLRYHGYIEISLSRTPRFNEFSKKKQPKCSLYRGTVNN